MNWQPATTGAHGHLISVIVPTYNRRSIISQSLDSVLAQDWPRIELVVVDDGSSDGTAEHLRKEYDTKIRRS